jgi:DNA-binding CsgD family transcriptional regulator
MAAVEIMVAVGDLAMARKAAAELSAMAAGLGAPFLRAVSAHALGTVLLAGNDPGVALASLRAAWMEWQATEVPYEAARVRLMMGLACRQLGDEEGARMELEAARAVFVRLEATPDMARVDRLLSARPAGAGALTPRELQVIRLIAAGRTNRAIARALTISERTVDRHVSNILTKLDLSSRSAATAYAYEHGLV